MRSREFFYDDYVGEPPPAPAYTPFDRVRVIDPHSLYYGMVGTVTAIEDEPLGGGEFDRRYVVKLSRDCGDEFREDELEAVRGAL